MKVIIGSENPTKLDATKQAFAIVRPDTEFEFESINAPSNVAEQPTTEAESIRGGRNRAKFVLENTNADFAIGMEGGMYELNGNWFVSDWAVVLAKDGREGLGGTPRYQVPAFLAEKVTPDFDLSAVLEKELGTKDIGKLHGFAGMTTGNHITRTASNRDAIVIALAPFIRDFWKSN